jgi:hypothetical protein
VTSEGLEEGTASQERERAVSVAPESKGFLVGCGSVGSLYRTGALDIVADASPEDSRRFA